jgi:hypothetical protein
MCTDIEGASTFRSDILVNIRDAKVFLILLDEKWAASNECMFEYNYAQVRVCQKYTNNAMAERMYNNIINDISY